MIDELNTYTYPFALNYGVIQLEKSNGMQITGFSFTSKGLIEIREIIEIPGNHESCKK